MSDSKADHDDVLRIEAEDVLVCAIDQGTSSTRVMLFRSTDWQVVAMHQIEFKSHYPKEGWVEQDPLLILDTVKQSLECTAEKLRKLGGSLSQVSSIGITNQRETTVVWDKETGKPLHNAVVWLDSRTKDIVQRLEPTFTVDLKTKCGLPISTYFSATKLVWLMENVAEVRSALADGRLMVGTIDTWLIWNLTGRRNYVTDVTNASRTMLMDLKSRKWDADLCNFFGIDPQILPQIATCSEPEKFGCLSSDFQDFADVPITGCIGDQQGALVGHRCFAVGSAKSTYGTGCFMLYNVGQETAYSNFGMLSTVGYQLGSDQPPAYALEGSIAVAGSAINWLKSVGILSESKETDELVSSVSDSGGLCFVPAFNGLFAPHWRPDARGMMIGITQYTRRAHIVRATLEAIAFQTHELLDAMQQDSTNSKLNSLCVDGGMTKSSALMNILAGFLGIPVVRPKMAEITALGAATVAAIGKGVVTAEDLVKSSTSGIDAGDASGDKVTLEKARDADWDEKFARWKVAVEKSLNWSSSSTAKL